MPNVGTDSIAVLNSYSIIEVYNPIVDYLSFLRCSRQNPKFGFLVHRLVGPAKSNVKPPPNSARPVGLSSRIAEWDEWDEWCQVPAFAEP